MKKTLKFGLSALLALGLTASAPRPTPTYLDAVRSFADLLLQHAPDRFGPRHTAQWASVVDTHDGSVPRRGVPTVAGVRPHDRAVGGSNAYQDLQTIGAFRVLSDLTGDARYRRAADAYLADALRYTTSPATGLLGWGEHLFYDVYEERVRVDSAFAVRPAGNGGFYHEFLADTPPWAEFWVADSVRTAGAIRGVKYHFWGPDAPRFLFNRHGHWDKPVYQKPEISQPWIKHSGLQAYSFLFLAAKTRDPEALRMAEGSASLYWNHRNPQTALTPSCIGDPRPEAQATSLSGTALLAYFLQKGSAWAPPDWKLPQRAATLLAAAETHCWDETRQTYRVGIATDGSAPPPASKRTGQTHLTAWVSGYGTANLFEVGRTASSLARQVSAEPAYRRLAERCARAARREPAPDTLVADNVGEAIHLNLDLYELTKKAEYLRAAGHYGQLALRHLYRRGWLVRRTDDRFYEAKLGVGTVALALLRLHVHQLPAGEQTRFLNYDWSK